MGNFAAGLLGGFGKGLQAVGKNRIEQERTKAAELRAKNMARFNQRLSDESWENRQESTRAYKDEVRTAEQERAEGLLEEKRDILEKEINWVLNEDGEIEGYQFNGRGERVPIEGVKPPADVKQKLLGTGVEVAKYDNSLSDDARRMLNEKFMANIYQKIGEGESVDAFMINNSVTGIPEPNMPLIRSKFPEEAKQLDAMQLDLQRELQKTPNPEIAYNNVLEKYKSYSQAQIDKAYNEQMKKLTEETGLSTEKLEAIKTKEFTSDDLLKMANNFDVNDSESLALEQLRPTLFKEVVKKAKEFENSEPDMAPSHNLKRPSNDSTDTEEGLLGDDRKASRTGNLGNKSFSETKVGKAISKVGAKMAANEKERLEEFYSNKDVKALYRLLKNPPSPVEETIIRELIAAETGKNPNTIAAR